MAVNINVPSQVKTYANLAAFPATGALKTIYIAEDTNKTYRWTGSVYVEISASAAMTWGQIGGTLSNQTDLQNALDAKVPTSRTLTINGVTQDLSADRTFTISTGITVGTTPISSGTIGRVLFQGTGNVVQESSSLFWDATNNRLGIGTETPSSPLHVIGSATSGFDAIRFKGQYSETGYLATSNGAVYFASGAGVTGSFLELSSAVANLRGGTTAVTFTVGSERMRVNNAGNVLIGTTTDAGFRLDVNGTARVQGSGTGSTQMAIIINGTSNNGAASFLRLVNSASSVSSIVNLVTGNIDNQNPYFAIENRNNAGTINQNFRIWQSGNVTIQNGGTFTDAGFRLDVNGSMRATTLRSDNPVIGFSPSAAGVLIGSNQAYRIICDGSNYYDFRTNTGIVYRLRDDGSTSFGSNTIAASAMVDIQSTTKGFLPPRMTTTQKNAIASPAAGLMVYDTTLNVISYYNGSMWI